MPQTAVPLQSFSSPFSNTAQRYTTQSITMLGTTIQDICSEAVHQWKTASFYPAAVTGTVFSLAALWIAWRVWSFTILPWFRPREPRELPHCIPGMTIVRAVLESRPLTESMQFSVRHGVMERHNCETDCSG